jgi:hypothetical protein
LGASGGGQTQVIQQAHFPNISLPVTDPGHIHSVNTTQGVPAAGTNNMPIPSGPGQSNGIVNPAFTGISVSTGGSGTPLPIVPPALVTNYILFAGA